MLVPTKHEVVDCALGAEEFDILECPRDATAPDEVGSESRDTLTLKVDFSRRRLINATDAVEGCGFPRAIRSDDRKDHSSIHLEGHVVKRGQPPEAHREAIDSEKGHRSDLPLVVAPKETRRPEPEHNNDDQERHNRLEFHRDIRSEEILDHT